MDRVTTDPTAQIEAIMDRDEAKTAHGRRIGAYEERCRIALGLIINALQDAHYSDDFESDAINLLTALRLVFKEDWR